LIPLSHVAWGPTDAIDRDKHFAEKWVEPDEIKKCLRSDNWIITGEKGAGKTAIRKALVEIYGNEFFAAPVVDFNDISFKVLNDHLIELANTTKVSKTATLSHFWQYAIVVEAMVAAARKNYERYGDLIDRIPADRANIAMNERLMRLIEEVWNRIDEFTGTRNARSRRSGRPKANLVASSGLTAKLIQQLSKFPLDPEFEAIKRAFFERIEGKNDRIVLILDGFDRLKNDGGRSDATKLIFASLIDSVYAIHADPHLPPSFQIKAFMPHDRYLSLPLRDSDKIDTMHVSIRWTRDTLQAFLKRRLELTKNINHYSTFVATWRQVMPDTIRNATYQIDEDSFDYLARHTMLRPRQMQIHLEQLATDYYDKNIDPSMVPAAVGEASKKIAKYFVDEFKTDYPYLSKFISSLHRQNNVMEYREFSKLVEGGLAKFHKNGDAPDFEDMIDTLYAMGFFGVLNFVEPGRELPGVYCPPSKESRRHFVDFFFKSPHPSVSGTLQDTSVVALHPVFTDYCSLRPHSTLIVG
jgi:hypothetical protein